MMTSGLPYRGSALVLITVALLAGCGRAASPPAGQPGSDPSSVSQLEGEWWLVSGFGSEGAIHVAEPGQATMVIEGPRIAGTAICNHYDGTVRITGSSFQASTFAVTEMGCLPARNAESEQAFLTALTEVDQIVRDEDRLTLEGSSARLRFTFHPPPPTPELVGTRWQLNGLVEGRGPGGAVSSVQPARLRLRADGTLVGSTGCRRFDASWKQESDTIQITSFQVGGECRDHSDQDAQVISVLSGGFTFSIREQSLDLYQLGGDAGLTYTTGLR